MRELGHFIERPARVTAEMQAATAELVAAHPEIPDLGASFESMSDAAKALRFQSLSELRQQRAATWTEMLLDDIEALLSASVTTR